MPAVSATAHSAISMRMKIQPFTGGYALKGAAGWLVPGAGRTATAPRAGIREAAYCRVWHRDDRHDGPNQASKGVTLRRVQSSVAASVAASRFTGMAMAVAVAKANATMRRDSVRSCVGSLCELQAGSEGTCVPTCVHHRS